MDCVQIGALVSRDPKSVWNWLKDFGIPTRPRGTDPRQHFKPGHRVWRPAPKAKPIVLAPKSPGNVGRKHTEETKAKIRAARQRDGHYPKNADGRGWWTGRSGPQHPAWHGGNTPERQHFYASDEWKRASNVVYARAGGKCERCSVDRSQAKMHVHHRWPFIFEKMRADPGNLHLLCATCHRFVHSRANEDREFLPPFGVLHVVVNGVERKIYCNYRPTKEMIVPPWLSAPDTA